MASKQVTGYLDLAATFNTQVMLAGVSILQPNQGYSLPLNFSFDFNITSQDSAGTLEIYFQNDPFINSPWLTSPYLSFPVSGGTFAGGQTKQSIDSNGMVFMAYMGVRYVPTAGTGTINFVGNVTVV